MPDQGRQEVYGDRSDKVRLVVRRLPFRVASVGILFRNNWLSRRRSRSANASDWEAQWKSTALEELKVLNPFTRDWLRSAWMPVKQCTLVRRETTSKSHHLVRCSTESASYRKFGTRESMRFGVKSLRGLTRLPKSSSWLLIVCWMS